MKFLDGIDYGALYHFQKNPIPVFDSLCPVLAHLGGYPFLAAIVLLGAILLRLQGRFRALLFLVVTFFSTAALAEVLKFAIRRTRPDEWQGPAMAGFSFPSNEAMVSAVVYFSLALFLTGRRQRKLPRLAALLAALFLTVSVGFAEIYLRRHFVSDVLGGWLAAAIVLLAATWMSSFASDPEKQA